MAEQIMTATLNVEYRADRVAYPWRCEIIGREGRVVAACHENTRELVLAMAAEWLAELTSDTVLCDSIYPDQLVAPQR